MTVLAVIRHGPTASNAAGRFMGRADEPLSPEGRRVVAGWRLPPELAGFAAVASPLKRAQETALLLGLAAASEPALIEMDWGTWQGSTRQEMVARLGEAFATAEALGLDLTPEAGESPRQVQARLQSWLRTLSRPTVAVTHKGVIRALVALATDWRMLGPEPVALSWSAAHLFDVDQDGRVRVRRLNLPLAAQPCPPGS